MDRRFHQLLQGLPAKFKLRKLSNNSLNAPVQKTGELFSLDEQLVLIPPDPINREGVGSQECLTGFLLAHSLKQEKLSHTKASRA